ncbi:helix-turn-helix domain-containing protein [Ningiella sp. W23]|uniref:helix-turn-helix domain-containing protein n=1 Tax=Ningiella sp. W23 TaxID=3023715 RepID=UPI0037578F3A
MPKPTQKIHQDSIEALKDIGAEVKQFRKSHSLTQIILAETLEIDRRTLAKLERGDASITIGTAFHILKCLGFSVSVQSPTQCEALSEALDKEYLPMQIKLSDYPVLRRCAWQLKADDTVTPPVAFTLYQNKKSDFETRNMSRKEQSLVACLEQVYGSL